MQHPDRFAVWLLKLLVAAALSVVAMPASADAATLHVATYGVDGFACGDADSPCRSIGRAIALAAAGDTVIVGPGRYGDVNADGDFDDPGDEQPEVDVGSCLCLINVDKRRLRLRSRDGAGVTVIDAGDLPVSAIHVGADGVIVGGRKRGFTLLGGHRGVRLGASVTRATIEGNVAIVDAGDPVSDPDAGLYSAGFVVDGNRNLVRGNAAVVNPEIGFVILGSEHYLGGNLASLTRLHGFYVPVASADHAVVSNFAIANDEDGIFVDVEGHARLLNNNVLVGNRGAGIALDRIAPGPISVRWNNIYGNGVPAESNCGLWNSNPGVVIDAIRNFWGFAGGPAAEPGNEVCNIDASEADTDPFAATEIVHTWLSIW